MTDFVETLPEDLQRVVAFHGHYCPGIMWGYIPSVLAMERLGADRAKDEELIAIVENDSCAADAVQVITGCTFGKGNFFFRDHGKHVYTFALRPGSKGVEKGRGIRLSRRADLPEDPEDESREAKVLRMLNTPAEDLYTITEGTMELPDAARIHESILCTRCGEPTMATRVQQVDGKPVCLACVEGITGLL